MHVTADLDLRLVLGGDRMMTIPATLTYSAHEPYAVTAVFRTSDGDVSWVFGRDLLEDGLASPAGEGDVAVWPSMAHGRRIVCLSLVSPSGSALLEADHARVRAFLDDSLREVPRGTETALLDLDAGLAALLDDDTVH
jgi:hypothetical protein